MSRYGALLMSSGIAIPARSASSASRRPSSSSKAKEIARVSSTPSVSA